MTDSVAKPPDSRQVTVSQTTDEPSYQKLAAVGRSEPMRVSGRLRRAIEAMIYQGKSRAEAAALAGLKDNSLRIALKKSHVLAVYNQELAALRSSSRARTFHRLEALRDQDENKMAAVAASKTLEAPFTEGSSVNVNVGLTLQAGWIIDLSGTRPGEQAQVIEPAGADDGDDADEGRDGHNPPA